MTLATRNNFIRFSTIVVLILAVLSLTAFLYIAARETPPSQFKPARSLPIFSLLFFTPYSSLSALAAVSFFPLVSLAGLIYILFAFEKTQSTEITFFAAAVFSFSLEAFRIIIPLNDVWMNTSYVVITVSRIILFSRLFVVLCLLSSIIFTTGQTSQQVGPAIFLTAFFSFNLVLAVPFNTVNLDTTFFITPGYALMIYIFLGILGILAVISYLIQGRTRNAKEYSRAAGGLLLLIAGYALLSVCDSWVVFGAGVLAVLEGSYLYLKEIHRYYLWQ